jgi:transposase
MQAEELFRVALGFGEQWEVVDTQLDVESRRRLDVKLDFVRGAQFSCPECGCSCGAYDTALRMWRHLDFMQYTLYMTAPLPRVQCPEHGVKQITAEWARPRSGFTLLFEALVMVMVREMPVKAVANIVGETDVRLWRVVNHYVDEAVEAQDLSATERVGIDDTSSRRGQDYVSVFCDLDERRAVYVTEGRDASTVKQFAGFLGDHGGDSKRVIEVSQDMSDAYIAGVRDHLPSAQITFDRFHVKKHLGDALDEVRREEAKQHKGLLKNTRYLWLKRPENLTVKQHDWLDELLAQPLQIARAYEHALKFDYFYELDEPAAEEYLRRWIEDVRATDITPLHRFANMLESHWAGIIRWHHSRISNGLLEGLNSLIQATKRRARGYRTTRNYKSMVYLVAGKLDVGPAVT